MQAQGTASASVFGDDIEVQQGRLTVRNEEALRSAKMDALVRQAVFGEGQAKDHAQWMIWEMAQAVGVRPASIHELYAARGRGEVKGFTVPAMNVRGMAYDTARAIFRTARAHARRRVHPRDRALGDRIHGAASGRVRDGDARGRAARRLSRARCSFRAITSR